ncbi:hypothetical protein BDK89_4070 [Ilumatobacter fluminis]|uniref:Uncharacterized protein n=2 Tax=Ilumatobacter fluminis TaxID=467091 RepID=A0A4R7I551_9ACTN|nr:hypothetical protein BDK89_4070 [Ilumatobacter fluminis]
MLEFQWNALRTGDRVVVHDDADPRFGLHDATVSMVRTRFPGASEIGVRCDDRPSVMTRPWRHAVHLVPLEGDPDCWRCSASATNVSPTAVSVAPAGS